MLYVTIYSDVMFPAHESTLLQNDHKPVLCLCMNIISLLTNNNGGAILFKRGAKIDKNND